MSDIVFATPQEAEAAFYTAFESASLEAMRQVWLEDDNVTCIHPMGTRLHGYAAVLHSWRQILDQAATLRIRIGEPHCTLAGQLAIHKVNEYLQLDEGRPGHESLILATNIYQLTAQGWRLILHHASPGPQSQPGRGRQVSDTGNAPPHKIKLLH